MTTTTACHLNTGGREYRPRTRFTFTVKNADFSGTVPRTVHFHFHRPRLDSHFYTPGRQRQTQMSQVTIEIENRHDRWRFVCPRGHRSWEPTNHHFWCAKCARAEGVDGVFHELRDQKSGHLIERQEVRLLDEVGPFDQDLDRRGSA